MKMNAIQQEKHKSLDSLGRYIFLEYLQIRKTKDVDSEYINYCLAQTENASLRKYYLHDEEFLNWASI